MIGYELSKRQAKDLFLEDLLNVAKAHRDSVNRNREFDVKSKSEFYGY
jgi:hypothetical protein